MNFEEVVAETARKHGIQSGPDCLADQFCSAVFESLIPALSMEHNQDGKVAVDRRAIPHLPGLLALNKCTGIENVGCLG
jgi:hypothetical protein